MSFPNADDLEVWLVSRLADTRGMDARGIDPRERFHRYGLDSLGAMRLLSDLSQRLGRALSPTLVWEYPTPRALAKHLTEDTPSAAPRSSIPPPTSVATNPSEPIAIVGMACRLPKAPSIEAFWQLLRDGVDAITEVPRDRWDAAALYDSNSAAVGKLNTRWGGFLDRVDQFDPQFFGISPREAVQMDPQQRLVLELVWEALEDGGIVPASLKDSRTGVFVGALFTDHALLQDRAGWDAITAHTSTGGASCIIANRVSYVLGLQGPSMTVDTACSSSSVAVHLACQSLRSGESSAVIAGGVSLMLVPETTMGFTKLNAMSPDGRCRAFDAQSNGYVRSEGAGIVLLKRLSDALRDGDRIYAVIRGSAVNNDGASNGLTAPNPKAQESMLVDAYRAASLSPGDVHYVEAHGTGTPLGDPIEAKALGNILGAEMPADRMLHIGSVKTNLGHLEAAAGIAGLMKVALAMHHDELPPSLHFQTPNPNIDFEALHLHVVARLQAWPAPEGERRRAGVSSFGYGGTNAHVILESMPRPTAMVALVEAGSDASLDAAIEKTLEQVRRDDTLGERVIHGPSAGVGQRIAVVASTASGLMQRLEEVRIGADGRGIFHGQPRGSKRLAWVFSGQGSQWSGMGRMMVHSEPAFRAAIVRCDQALQPYLGWSVLDEILAGCPRVTADRIDVMWPVLFTFQVSLANLLHDLGIKPALVVGHSIGEVSAAHVTGALTLEDASRVIAQQSRYVQKSVGKGIMLLAAVDWTEGETIAANSGGRINCAIAASPKTTVFSGDATALAALGASLAARGTFNRAVQTGVAVHGPQMDYLKHELPRQLIGLRPKASQIPIVSGLSGKTIRGEDLDVGYWSRQLCEPVRFGSAIQTLLDEGIDVFLEVAPHPIVKQSIEECIEFAGKAQSSIAIATLWRNDDEGRAIREAVGTMFVHGTHVVNRQEEDREYREGYVHLLPVSGQIDLAMRDAARNLAMFMERSPQVPLRDISYVSGVRRTHHRVRAIVTGRNRTEMLDGLSAIAERREHQSARVGMAPIGNRRGLVFVFPGQGSQWAGMGRTLFVQKIVFREVIEACDAIVQRESGFSVVEELLADEAHSQLSRIDVVQPMLFAVGVALAALWRSWGVEPDCVIGHSMGEIAAAHVAGVLSLEDAIKIICRRSKLLKRVAGQGAMATVELSMVETEGLLDGFTERLSVAVSNGPRATVISGEPAALENVLAKLEERAVFFRRIKVDVASHSPQMDGLLNDLGAALNDLRPQPATLKMRSTVTAELVAGPELDASYWTRNLRDPVLFGQTISQAISDGQSLFLEISPHPVLVHSIEDTLRELSTEGAAIPSLRRNELERRGMVEALGALHVYGHELSWNKLFPHGGQCMSLPTYSWQKDRYWLPDDVRSRLSSSSRHHSNLPFIDPDAHPLLGPPLVLSIDPALHVWENSPNIGGLPYLSDHCVQGEAVFPGAGYVEMALAAIAKLHGNVPTLLEEVSFDRMLPVSKEADRRVQFVLMNDTPNQASFRISSRHVGESSWTLNATGKVRMGMGVPVARIARDRPRVIQARCTTILTSNEFYARMEQGGLSYGRAFRGIETMWIGPLEALTRCFLHPDHFGTVEKYQVHPALLDACFQALMGVHLSSLKEMSGTFVLSGVDRLRIHRALGTDIWVHAELHPTDNSLNATGDVFVIDAEGRVIAEVNGLQIKHLESNRAASTSALDDSVYAIEWRKKELDAEIVRAKSPTGPSAWLFFIDEGGTAASISFLLVARGEACVRVRRGTQFARVEAGLYEIDPGNTEHYQRLLREAFGRELACKGIVHLPALDSATWATTTAESITQDIERGCLSVMYLVQAMARQGWRDMPRLWIVTRGAQAILPTGMPLCVSQATLWGLGRTIALEHPEFECTRIDMDPARSADEASLLWREISGRSREDQVAYREEGRFVARLVRSSFDAGEATAADAPMEPANGRTFRVECPEVGHLEQLVLRESSRRAPGLGEVEIQVEAAGLNFFDVEKAQGLLPTSGDSCHFGMECAGRIIAIGPGVDGLAIGEEVIAFALNSLGSHVTTAAEFVVPKPSKISFAEAASIPVVFMTAYYALNKVARLGHDERILIHTATGGTGLAAIQMARVLQAEIFATAGNDEKRALLRSMGIDHVMNSRTLSFGEDLLEATGGQGVDVVLNTLTGDARTRSFELLAPYGRFVELSKRDIYLNTQMPPLRRSVSFASVDLSGMAQERPSLLGSLLHEVVQLFEMGVFQPLPVRAFPARDVRSAFQLMARAEHIGKVVLDMSDPTTPILPVQQEHRRIGPDATYLITGGLGGLGLSLAQWIVEQGGRHLALVSRSEPSPAAREAIVRMENAGAKVLVALADITHAEQAAEIVSLVERSMPPLRGVVHAAGILDDRTLLEMDAARFLRVLEPKVMGAFHLHALTAKLPLDFFVFYSSVASLLGAPGQGNYSAGNAFMDALAHSRRRMGLAGMSIHWGPFADVGLAATHDSRGQRLSYRGVESLTPSQGLLAFSRLLDRPRAEVGILRLAVHQWVEFYPQVAASSFWSELQREKRAQDPSDKPSSSRVSFKQSLERRPTAERQTALEYHILEHVGQVLRLDISRIDRLSSFTSLGMDSLLSLELRNRLESSLSVRLSATLLFTYPNPASLADYLIERMNLTSVKHRTSETGPIATVGTIQSDRSSTRSGSDGTKPAAINIRQMSVAEAELLLEEELARSEDYLQ